jgi:hypothetical protein
MAIHPKRKAPTTVVRFIEKMRPYNAGEIAGFKSGPVLDDLIRRRIVERVPPEDIPPSEKILAKDLEGQPITGAAGAVGADRLDAGHSRVQPAVPPPPELRYSGAQREGNPGPPANQVTPAPGEVRRVNETDEQYEFRAAKDKEAGFGGEEAPESDESKEAKKHATKKR